MKKYDLLRSGDNIIRVLEVQGDRVLIIDCIKRTMPMWVDTAELESYSECTSDELSEVTGVVIIGVDDLDADQRKTMCQRRYEIVRKRRRNFVVFRRQGGDKIKRFLAQKECSQFAASGA